MFYIERAADGTIIALHNQQTATANETRPFNSPEVLAFLSSTDSWKQAIALSDMTTVRILEDLIDLLIRKNLINFTELPVEAQERLNERKGLRAHLTTENGLLVDDIM